MRPTTSEITSLQPYVVAVDYDLSKCLESDDIYIRSADAYCGIGIEVGGFLEGSVVRIRIILTHSGLGLNNNQLTGSLPDLESLTNLNWLLLGNNRITNRANQASLEVMSADGHTAYGIRSHWLVVDELAAWPDTPNTQRLWTAIVSAARPGSFLMAGAKAQAAGVRAMLK